MPLTTATCVSLLSHADGEDPIKVKGSNQKGKTCLLRDKQAGADKRIVKQLPSAGSQPAAVHDPN